MIIFVCIKYTHVPVLPQNKRFLFKRVCFKSYHIFHCIVRYGYKHVRNENHKLFQRLLLASLERFNCREALEIL
ncbi:putative potassium transporter [Helianthus annuus]|nr:putative potassium transporter [Helianthus annuus]